MKRVLCLLVCCCVLPAVLCAQSGKLIKDLEGRRGRLQQQIAEADSMLASTRNDVGLQLDNLALLTGQIEERRRYIGLISADVEALDREIVALDRQLDRLGRDLQEKRKRYEASVLFLYRHRGLEEKLMFIISADGLAQTYRRLRYVRQYADFQRRQGEDIVDQQRQIDARQAELQQTRAAKQQLLAAREQEKRTLEAREQEKRALVASLRRRQRGLQAEVERKRREAAKLNARIDKLIAEELERARREAEAARAAEARKKAAPVRSQTPPAPSGGHAPSGSFAQSRGRLPMPVSGPCFVVGHYGRYDVEGLRNVRLDNKGIDIQARPGAQARAVFGGRVAAVFQLNGLFNVLVRHGAYISVYCNLSSALVKVGDEVQALQPLGQVFTDQSQGGRTVLHFQLRRERQKLDPEQWLAR